MKALIQTATPETAQGDVKKGYEIFKKRGLAMPDPMQLMTASPDYFSIILQRSLYYSNHPRLSLSLLAHIRFFAASRIDYGFCTQFNKSMLLKMGMTPEEFEIMGDDPEKSVLEEMEKKMLCFVVKAMADPESVGQEDIDRLRRAGWQDSDMLDALAQGVGMMDHNIFLRVFNTA